MTTMPEPHLSPVAILDLRPTQITVGLIEVKRKRSQWLSMATKNEAKYLGNHLVPVVIGPAGHFYLTDHHHLALALHGEGVKHVLTIVQADLSELPKKQFWTVMERMGWAHPFDEDGKRQPASNIPKSLTDLKDDPYRSLAGELRRRGGYAKTPYPYTEFLWADHFRHQISRHILCDEFDHAVTLAMDRARDRSARYLPGWCGPEAAP